MPKSNKEKTFGKNFIILPLVFITVSFISFYLVLSPILTPVVSVLDMVFSKDYSQSNTKTIYTGEGVNSSNGVIKLSEMQFPALGEIFGSISIENTDIQNVDLYFGDSMQDIRNGVGVYNGSSVPGGGGTTLIAGHNNTYFNGLKNVQPGYKVNIKTNYGDYVYSITDAKPAHRDDTSAYPLTSGEYDLIMYTCYPFDVLGFKTQRYFVYAELISGPTIDFNS